MTAPPLSHGTHEAGLSARRRADAPEAHLHRAYGLTIKANRRLCLGVPSAVAPGEPDVVLDLPRDDGPEPTIFAASPTSGVTRTPTGFEFWFDGEGRLSFQVDRAGRTILARWNRATYEEISALMMGAVFAAVLRLRGTIALHACVAEVDGRAVAIIGPSGAGKSTLAAHLAASGTAILADDVAALVPDGSGFRAEPGYPRLKLWPDTLRAVGADHEAHRPVYGMSAKRIVTLRTSDRAPAWRFQPRPLELAAIILLERRRDDIARPQAARLAPPIAMRHLLAHRSVRIYDLGTEVERRELAALGPLAGAVPMWRLTCPNAMGALPLTLDTIREVAATRMCGAR